MLARIVLGVSLLVMIGAALVWYRGDRDLHPTPIAEVQRPERASLSNIYPGGAAPPLPATNTRYEVSGYDVSEGQHLFRMFNCNGCHQNGGGGIGPALMDDRWTYGSDPPIIFESIVEGRPNGMPSFRGKVTEQQTWQLVAYVRSLSGLVPSAARSARPDHMQSTPPSTLQGTETPKTGGTIPPSSERPQ